MFKPSARKFAGSGSCIVLLLLLIGCAGSQLPNPSAALERSWRLGQHRLPQAALQPGRSTSIEAIRERVNWADLVKQQQLRAGATLPAVIYLHGCAGDRNSAHWWALFNRLGYAMFAPDSLARPRQSLCDGGNMKNRRIPLRLRELNYALQQLKTLDWIDQKRLVLVGFSEGAQAAAAYRGNDFAAIVLMGTNCRFSDGAPQAGRKTPVLSLMGARDRYYRGLSCRSAGRNKASASLVIDGDGHNLRNNPQVISAITDFISQAIEQP